MRKLVILVAAAAAGSHFVALAQQPKPEDQIKMRKAAYTLMGYTFGSLEDMAKGKKPFAQEQATRDAELLMHLSRVPKGFFGEGSDKGETRAKAEVWTKRPDFDAKMDKMVSEVAKLAQATRSGDPAAFRKAVAETDDACSACHKEYRERRRG
jgi:cytochrome c556